MNDRIYELAEQAAEFTDANEFAAIERRIWDSIFREKFAELIVRECAQVASEWVKEPTMLSIENKIKWRFGVE